VQTTQWIELTFGAGVGLGKGDIVLGGHPNRSIVIPPNWGGSV